MTAARDVSAQWCRRPWSLRLGHTGRVAAARRASWRSGCLSHVRTPPAAVRSLCLRTLCTHSVSASSRALRAAFTRHRRCPASVYEYATTGLFPHAHSTLTTVVRSARPQHGQQCHSEPQMSHGEFDTLMHGSATQYDISGRGRRARLCQKKSVGEGDGERRRSLPP